MSARKMILTVVMSRVTSGLVIAIGGCEPAQRTPERPIMYGVNGGNSTGLPEEQSEHSRNIGPYATPYSSEPYSDVPKPVNPVGPTTLPANGQTNPPAK